MNVYSCTEAWNKNSFKRRIAARRLAPCQNNDQRGSSLISPNNFAIFHDYYLFYQPCFSRLRVYAGCFCTGLCNHDYFAFVFQHHLLSLSKHTQQFFHGTHDRFLLIVPTLNDKNDDVTTTFNFSV